jgi:hypothetical protein
MAYKILVKKVRETKEESYEQPIKEPYEEDENGKNGLDRLEENTQ